jgi:two-component system, LytTR family, response regulator
MIRTVIIDDEPRNIKLIRAIVHEHCPQLHLVGSTDDISDALPLIRESKPELLLLDIEFPSGTIFPILEKLPAENFQIIFITAHNTYAAEAFRQNAVDYILKPITKDALIQAAKKVETRIHNSTTLDVSKLITVLRSGLSHSKKIPLPSSEGILFVNEEDIIRCEASGRYTIIYLKSNKKLTVTRTLKEIEALLSSQFFRVHNSHIINLEEIRQYHRSQRGMIELNDGSIVEISSSRKNELMEILLNKPGS